ncbi:hypothetical protein ACFO8O_10700 [Hephaestia sp. GCM10023244]|uniref:hypothetical protein n=1 Tax=unclassified Hephaestia TaxID=2631281 RepID=UPI0020778278|nr:hypothetical protein [Hephaestia sp. MAHUQ-44]MCM8731428.1 hypothetical protein [Hephaestia sp. MAHUQ-44]
MSIFTPILDRARTALAAAEAAEAQAHAELEAHRKVPADPGDAAAIKDWRAIEAKLSDELEVAESVVAHWRGAVAEQEVRAERDALAAEHKKLVVETDGAAAKRIRAITDAMVKLRAMIDEDAAYRARVDNFNIRRGDLPFIVDAETKLRTPAGRTRPAITQKVIAYFDADGRRYGSRHAYNEQGEVVIRDDLIEREVEDIIHAESREPGIRPERFVDAVKLVDMRGRPL